MKERKLKCVGLSEKIRSLKELCKAYYQENSEEVMVDRRCVDNISDWMRLLIMKETKKRRRWRLETNQPSERERLKAR